MRRTAFLAALVLLAAGLAPRAAVGAALRIAVAPFEVVAQPGQSVPDLADRLAQRLATRGAARVVGPAQLGASPGAEPDASAVSGIARDAGVGSLVVGRTTRIGRSLSINAQVLDGSTGSPVGSPLLVDIPDPEQLGRAIDGLADGVIDRLGGAPAATAPEGGEPSGPSDRFDSKEPISIQAEELEHEAQGDRKYFVFSGDVHATQGDLDLRSDRLEAFYPPGGSSPERLVATGSVRLTQGEERALCREATFYRTEDRVVCIGKPAQLDRGCDRVRGAKITFFLDSEVLQVQGGADVDIRSDDARCAAPAVGAGP